MTDTTTATQLTSRLRDALTDLQAVLDDYVRADDDNAQLAAENKELRREVERLRQLEAAVRRENAAKWNSQREAWMAHIRSLEEALARRNHRIEELAATISELEDNADSDMNHRCEVLYDHLTVMHAAAVRAWRKLDGVHVIKSRRRADGEEWFGGGWFVVQANLPEGQVSDHYREKYWDLFDCPERHTAREWDGHTSSEVALERITNHERNSN